MKFRILPLLVGLIVGVPSVTSAQQHRATVIETAPIYLYPDANRTPLRTASVQTELRMLADEGDWLKVEFKDPHFGLRIGYIESSRVRVHRADLEPMDLSVREPAGVDVSRQSSQQFAAPIPDVTTSRGHARDGFWFNAGLGFGSLGCEDCLGRANGSSGGLSIGRTINDRLLLGVGTAGWARSDADLTVGLLDARLRFYPSATNGFFLTTGLGLGTLSGGGRTEAGLGLILGLGADFRISRNVSLTPFWNGFAMRSSFADANVGQLGLSITVH